MCGIGTYKSEKAFTDIDIARVVEYSKKTEVRGRDAFGIYNTQKIYKAPVTAHGFWTLVEEFNLWDKVFPESIKQVIWHNRLATWGTPSNNANNHPLESRNFVLVHNGAVVNAEEFKSEYPQNVEVDSYSILVCLERAYKKTRDTEKALESLSDLMGTIRIIVYDKNAKNTYVYTNSGEVLYKRAEGYIVVISETETRTRFYQNIKRYIEKYRFRKTRKTGAKGFKKLKDNIVYKITPDLELEEVAEVEVEEYAVYYVTREFYEIEEDEYEPEDGLWRGWRTWWKVD